MGEFGQLFSADTQAVFFNWKEKPVQRMLDFDFLCGEHSAQRLLPKDKLLESATTLGSYTGRKTPSVACIVQPGSSGFQKVFFGDQEIAIPMYSKCVYILFIIFIIYLCQPDMDVGPLQHERGSSEAPQG